MTSEHSRSSLVLFLALIAGLCFGALVAVSAASVTDHPNVRHAARTGAVQR